MLVIVCPGQGSQTPGFLAPWLELPGLADRLSWLSAVSGLDLVAHGTTSDADTIRDTAVAQPLIVAAGLVSLLEVFPQPSEAFAQVGGVAREAPPRLNRGDNPVPASGATEASIPQNATGYLAAAARWLGGAAPRD